MKVLTVTKIHLVTFICLIVCICGITTVTIGSAIQANTTPATNKTVILDAGHGVPEDGICLSYFLRM